MSTTVESSAAPGAAQSSSPTLPDDTLLTLAELARLLRYGKTRVYELAARNELPIPTLRIGAQYRFSRRAVDAWLQGDDQTTSA